MSETEHVYSKALWDLALLPLTLAWAVVKGLLVGILAVVTLGAIH